MSVAFVYTNRYSGNSSGTLTGAFTATGTNLAVLLGVFCAISGTDYVTGVTYGGVSMTNLATYAPIGSVPYLHLFGLTNAPSGAQNAVVSMSSTTQTCYMNGVVYSGVGAFEAAVTGNATSTLSLTIPDTTSVANCWLSGVFASNNTAVAAGTNSVLRGGTIDGYAFLDTNAALPAGANSINISTSSSSNLGGIVVALEPSGAASGQKGGMFFADNFRPKIPVVAAAMFMPLSWSINRRNRLKGER